jgi:hypothetical protein
VLYRYDTDIDSVTIDETAAKARSQQTVASLCWTDAPSATEVPSAGVQTGDPPSRSPPTSATAVSAEGDDGPSTAGGSVARFRSWDT